MNYKDVIESRYNRKNWLLLLRDIFGSRAKFWNAPYVVETNSQMARQALWLGTISLSDEQTIAIYEVELAESVDIERNRRGIRDMLLTQWRNNGNAGAFMFCYRENESVLRFSYVSESWKFADDGTYQKESTDTRRFTYLLGEGHRSRTAIQQFETLKGSAQTLKDLTKAFSVDAVSDMFFRDYKAQYANIIFYITGKRMVKKGNKWEEIKEGRACRKILDEFSGFADPEKAVRDYVKKLMGRLVFLQFLQKKGWLGVPLNKEWGSGDKEFIQNLFAKTRDKDNFIDDVLEVLFNDLNTERKNDISQFSIFNYQFKIPYLNGGLFERDATDETRFPLPAKYMEDMLEFFSRYNFTIDENDPNDAEVGVDPEMLGRIFENLLEDNKDKGAFYTPKEIVQYMCRESLIAYLQTDVKDESTKEAIRQFVTTHEVEHLGDNKKLAEQVDESLRNVKICDPAIGSGAFPMGLLKELYLCRSAIEGLDDDNASEIKKHIIQHNIYGVDIEKGAVDIARLRFWLSLIVDEKTPHALPNLDFKIMQGNSLLEQYKGVDLSAMTQEKNERGKNYQTTMFDDMLDVYRRELREMLNEYYQCTDHKEKKTLRKRIINNVKKQLKEQSINIDFGDLDLSGNDQFFLWHTWFHDVFSQGGFDIVIGNPPYIDSESMTNQGMGEIRNILVKQFELSGNWDIYMAFYEQAFAITQNIVCFITPDKWLSKPFGKKFRGARMVERMAAITRAGSKVFENATVDAIITIFINESDKLSVNEFESKKNEIKIKNKGFHSIKDLQDPFIIDYLFADNIDVIIKMDSQDGKIKDLAECEGACATSDAYKLQTYISEVPTPNYKDYYIVINTGTISKYYNRWGTSPMKYLGNSYLYPVVNRTNFNTNFGSTYVRRASRPKVIFKGLNLLDVCLDKDAIVLPAKSTNVICSEDINLLKFLCGLLNSKLVFYYIKLKYSSSSYCGGITFTKDMINCLPVNMHEDRSAIVEIVDKIILSKENSPLNDTSDLETQLDQHIYRLYNLNSKEINIVENSSK